MPIINGIPVQSQGSKPHVKHVMHQLAHKVPLIQKMGGKVDRTTRSGGFSAHSVGRAIDIYLSANNRRQLLLADCICNIFEEKWFDLKIDNYIWNTHWWSSKKHSAGEKVKYSGNNDRRGPHKDHIHVEFFAESSYGIWPTVVNDLIIPIHRYMATRDWDAPVSGWGSWDASNPELKTAVQ